MPATMHLPPPTINSGDFLMHTARHGPLMREGLAEIERQRAANSGPYRYRKPYKEALSKTGAVLGTSY